jgi:circadian clock protein KaiC
MLEVSSNGERGRVSTGMAQADEILGGGFPANSINILMGHPGTGKTIFAEQMLFHNADDERPSLYLTTLSEPLSKMVTFLQRFDFYDESRLERAIVYESVGADLAEHGIGSLVDRVREAIRTISPKIIVIDSFRVVHDLAASAAETRLLVSELAGLLTAYDVTTFLVGEYSDEHVAQLPEFAAADGIVQFARRGTSRRDQRYLRVHKLRGSPYREGSHAFNISSSGLRIHPRLITPPVPPDYSNRPERVATGIDGLDALVGGGFWCGSNTLLMGDAGTGKSTFGLCFAMEGIRRREPSLYLNFQENPVQLARTIGELGFDVEEMESQGLTLHYCSPVELQIDSIIVDLFDIVRERGVRRVGIDALGALALAAEESERFHDYMYAMTQRFSTGGVTSLMTLEGWDRHGALEAKDAVRLSAVADGIIILGIDFRSPTPQRTLRIAKQRGTHHDLRAHELFIHTGGLRVGEPATV